MQKVKVRGTQAQKLKPEVCAVASQRLALRGEQQKYLVQFMPGLT